MGSYLAPQVKYQRGEPSGKDNLIELYHLTELANSVARQDPVTGAKRKLRKSYKNHIADLPGKHTIPTRGETAWSLVELANMPAPARVDMPDLDADLLNNLRFEKAPATGVPGFDPKLLATATPQNGDIYAYSAAPSPADRKDRKKRKEAGPLPAEKRRKL